MNPCILVSSVKKLTSMNPGMPRQLICPIEPLAAADPRAGERQDVAVRDEVSSKVARLGVLSTAAGNVAVVLARTTLRE